MRGGTHSSFVMQLVQMRSKLHKMRGETQYKIQYLWNLCRHSQTGADEEWNTVQYFVMQLVQVIGGTQYWIQ